MIRVGLGYDVHRFREDGDHIMLCGVRIEHDAGIVAHSDGDVALHALTDAMLGALALGDIGQHFPDTDPVYAGADSGVLLQHVNRLIDDAHYHLNNADLTIVTERPYLSTHILSMRQRVADLLGAPLSAISIKATTSEKMGFVGRAEGIAAHAVVSLAKNGVS